MTTMIILNTQGIVLKAVRYNENDVILTLFTRKLGKVVAIIAFIFIKDINIVLIVSISLFINMIVGAMIGGFMPILFKKLDVDTSIISAPVIATLLDITGIAIYLITTIIILSKIV